MANWNVSYFLSSDGTYFSKSVLSHVSVWIAFFICWQSLKSYFESKLFSDYPKNYLRHNQNMLNKSTKHIELQNWIWKFFWVCHFFIPFSLLFPNHFENCLSLKLYILYEECTLNRLLSEDRRTCIMKVNETAALPPTSFSLHEGSEYFNKGSHFHDWYFSGSKHLC